MVIIAYAIIADQVWSGKIVQNIASRILWAVLDGMVAICIFAKGGINWKMPAVFSLGCIMLAVFIAKRSVWKWTTFHTKIAIGTGLCAIIWMLAGPVVATVAISAAVFLAGIPQVVDAYRMPKHNPVAAVAFQTLAAVLSVMGGEPSIIGRFFAGTCVVYFALLLGVTLRGRFIADAKPELSRI